MEFDYCFRNSYFIYFRQILSFRHFIIIFVMFCYVYSNTNYFFVIIFVKCSFYFRQNTNEVWNDIKALKTKRALYFSRVGWSLAAPCIRHSSLTTLWMFIILNHCVAAHIFILALRHSTTAVKLQLWKWSKTVMRLRAS